MDEATQTFRKELKENLIDWLESDHSLQLGNEIISHSHAKEITSWQISH